MASACFALQEMGLLISSQSLTTLNTSTKPHSLILWRYVNLLILWYSSLLVNFWWTSLEVVKSHYWFGWWNRRSCPGCLLWGENSRRLSRGFLHKKQYVVSCSVQSTLAGHSRSMLMEPLYCKSRPKSSIWRSKIDIFNFQKVKPYMGRTRRRRNASCHIFYEGWSWRLDSLLQNKYVKPETFKLEKQRNKPSFLPAAQGDHLAILAAFLLNLVELIFSLQLLENKGSR